MKKIRCFAVLLLLLGSISLPFSATRAQEAPAPAELLDDAPKPATPEADEPTQPALSPSIVRPGDLVPDEKKSPYENYSDIPKEALDEMEDFHKSCMEQSFLSKHYDCECWSMRYLDEMIKAGPEVPREQIMLGITDECFNIPGAAAYAHQKCENFGGFNYDGKMSPEQYCECVANNYALELQNMGERQLNQSRADTMMTRAYLRCEAPPTGGRNIFPRLDKPRE